MSKPVKKPTRTRAKPDEWIAPYLEALSRGHMKHTAAALAGVNASTPYKRAERDPDFAEREQIAYELGTAHYEQVALKRISDPDKPGDSVLKHLLSVRGLSARVINQLEGNDERPVFVIDAESYAGGAKRDQD